MILFLTSGVAFVCHLISRYFTYFKKKKKKQALLELDTFKDLSKFQKNLKSMIC